MNLAKTSSRRRFLKQSIGGYFALSVAGLFHVELTELFPSPDIDHGLLFFSPGEFTIMKSIADRMIGNLNDGAPDASLLHVASRADQFLSKADPEIQGQFHQLLIVFNAPLFTFLFDFRLSSFVKMRPEDQDSYLEDWMTSVLSFRRTGFQALKRVCLSMVYTEPESWKEIGFSGLDIPTESH